MSQSTHLAGVSWQHRAFLRTWVDVWSAVHSLTTPPSQSYSRARYQRCQTGQRFPRGEYSARSWPWSFEWRPKWCPEMKQIPRANRSGILLTHKRMFDRTFDRLFTRQINGWRGRQVKKLHRTGVSAKNWLRLLTILIQNYPAVIWSLICAIKRSLLHAEY